MTTACFTVELTDRDRLAFAGLPGDWNPLHTDAACASDSDGLLAKGLIPDLVQILVPKLAASNHRLAGITPDVVQGGMNRGLGPAMRRAHADRTMWGELPDMEEVAAQVRWVLDSSGRLLSGAMLDLTGGGCHDHATTDVP